MKVGLGPCKGKDTATTLGPYLATADELEPCRDRDGFLHLALTAEVNGEIVGRHLLSHMSWTFEEMAAYAARGTGHLWQPRLSGRAVGRARAAGSATTRAR